MFKNKDNLGHRRHWLLLLCTNKSNDTKKKEKTFFFKKKIIKCHLSGVTSQVTYVPCHVSPGTCHWRQQPQPLLAPPLCTAGCSCCTWPTPINNKFQRPKNKLVSLQQYLTISESNLQFQSLMYSHYFSPRNLFVIDWDDLKFL